MNRTRDEARDAREHDWQKKASNLHDRIHEVAALVDYYTHVEIGWAPEDAIPMLAAALKETYAAGERVMLERAIEICKKLKDNYHPSVCNCPRCYPSKKDKTLDAAIKALRALATEEQK